MTRLTDLRIIARLELRIGGVQSGSDGFIYAVDVVGQRLVGEAAPELPGFPASTVSSTGWQSARSTCGASKRSEVGPLKLLDFVTEPDCWRSWALGTLKPDAYLAVVGGEFEHHCFIEVDCATEASTTLSAKAVAHQRYYATGIEQARLGLFPQAVWAVPTDRRLAQLDDLLAASHPTRGVVPSPAARSAARRTHQLTERNQGTPDDNEAQMRRAARTSGLGWSTIAHSRSADIPREHGKRYAPTTCNDKSVICICPGQSTFPAATRNDGRLPIR